MAVFRRSGAGRSDRLDRDPDTSSFLRPKFIISAVLMLSVIGSGIVIASSDDDTPVTRTMPRAGASSPEPVSTRRGPGPAVPADDPSGSSSAPSGSGVPSSNGTCPATTPGTTIPAAAPNGVSWQLYHTVALPFSAIDGPRLMDGLKARCYSRSPVGALLAGMQITTRYVISFAWWDVAEGQIAAGAGRDLYITQRRAAEELSGPAGPPKPGDMRQFSGFRFVSYTPDVAVIQLLRRSVGGDLVGTVHTLVWVDGDWKLQLQPDGSDASITQDVDSLSGFVSWGAA